MPFDPFGDRATHGHLRNVLRTTDPVLIARLEAHSFAANILPALQALADKPRLAYEDVIDTHGRLFRSFYPWAGQDRATLAPDIAISKAGISDLFAHPRDVRRGIEYGLQMGLDKATISQRPGETFGALAFAHPFLEGNGRTIMVVHADLARRADFHIDWSGITKPEFLAALTAELRAPGSARDNLLRPHIRNGPLPLERTAEALRTLPGLNRPGLSPS